MDCKFINQNDIHERYLLDKLNETEKSEYLTHLNSCDSCKSNLDSEKETLASIRYFGKNEMKSEIARQVVEIKSRQKDVSWDMILKVAAIFFFLVITPGLVYYYQSVEPPQIGELYEFDEVLNQQQGTDKTETEENIETRNVANENRKSEIKDKTSDIIKSSGGAGIQPSVQPIGMAKPAKKSISQVEESAEIVAEIDIEAEKSLVSESNVSASSARVMKSTLKSEEPDEGNLYDNASSKMEQPKPTSPSSRLPELEKFVKPKFFRTMDHEYFKGKDIGNTTKYYSDPPKISKAPQSQSSIKTESGIYAKNLRMNQIYHLHYNINEKTIGINLIPLYDESEFYLQESYPDSFPVIKKKWHNEDITLDSFISQRIRKIDPVDILIYSEEDKYLYLNLLNEIIYQIDLKSDSTKAILIN